MSQREMDLAYLAGLIDGEGYIGISSNAQKTRKQYTPRVTITNTNVALINEVRRILDNESIAYHVMDWDARLDSQKVRYTVEANGFRRALKLLFIIEPYLVAKRQQAQFVLAWLWSRLTHGSGFTRVPYTDSETALVEAVKELNHKGREILREYTLGVADFATMMYSELRAKGVEATEMMARLDRKESWSRSK